jgi:hypothetical protein
MDSISVTEIILAVVSIATGVLGWFARQMWDAVQKLRVDLTELEIRIGSDYVRYDRLQDSLRPIMEALRDIQDSLKTKADK